MRRFALLLVVSVMGNAALALAQSGSTSDALAVSFAQRAIAALTQGTAVSDVTLSANVVSTFASSHNTGTGTFQAKGTSESRVNLSLTSGARSEIRGLTTYGLPTGGWQLNGAALTAYPQHNCWTDAAWFFPSFSSLSQTTNPAFVFKYVGQEQYNGTNVQHIEVSQVSSQNPTLARLSTMDFYLDAVSFLPLDMKFVVHADKDMNTNIQTEVRFSSYQSVSGIQIPFYFQRLINGNLDLDVKVTSAVLNSGLSDSIFSVQ